MAKLIYMRITEGFSAPLYDQIRFAPGYSKRALVTTTPDTEDVVLFDHFFGGYPREPVELAMLNAIGVGPRATHVREVEFDHQVAWHVNVEHNQAVIDWLRDKKFSHLEPFTGKSTICHLLAEELGIPIHAPDVKTSHWAESKQTLQVLNQKYHFSPRGFICRNNEDILTHWETLSALPDFSGCAVVKASQCASGTVSTVVSKRSELTAFLKQFNYAELDGAVIEEWVASEPISPSINYNVTESGEIEEAFISDQIFEEAPIQYGQHGTLIYRGNIFPSQFSKAIQDEIRAKSLVYLKELISLGVWGPIGFDAIVLKKPTDDAKIFISEINPRITGPRFAEYPMRNLNADYFCLQNLTFDPNRPIYTLQDELSPILFDKTKGEGFIPFNIFPGKCIGLVLSKKSDRLGPVIQTVNEHLKTLGISEFSVLL